MRFLHARGPFYSRHNMNKSLWAIGGPASGQRSPCTAETGDQAELCPPALLSSVTTFPRVTGTEVQATCHVSQSWPRLLRMVHVSHVWPEHSHNLLWVSSSCWEHWWPLIENLQITPPPLSGLVLTELWLKVSNFQLLLHFTLWRYIRFVWNCATFKLKLNIKESLEVCISRIDIRKPK